ncbi:MAG: SDR family oxidoreductase [Deltaproteobacteria bacterium]|jgi:3-oxoacyl-[acyl-carrier protein] reductase|nr:SDR family oxidoreductase [Deltaproteobacteria bacterium]
MDLQLKDKNIFIAGSSAGIGLATARAFLEEGACVMITGRGQERLDQAKNELTEHFGADRVAAMSGDMTKTDVLINCLDQCISVLGSLHSVIANVGIDDTSEDLDLDDETWTASLNQNLMGAVRLAREAASRLTGSQDGKAGNIVLISSIAGLRGFGGPLPYAVSKSGINQLAFELGMRLGRDSGIRVNSVAPGNILFPGGVWERMLAADEKGWIKRWIRRDVPFNRFGTPEEIADAVVWVASPRASFVNATVITVDGGQVKGPS